MSRILLVDDSPHAQRIGERILADEGFEVVTVSNADSALIRLEDVDPDLLIAKAVPRARRRSSKHATMPNFKQFIRRRVN